MSTINWIKRIVLCIVFIGFFTTTNNSLTLAQSANSLADSAWPMFQHDPQHTGRSQFQGIVNAPVKLWEMTVYSDDNYINVSPYLVLGPDGTLYTNSRDLFAIDPINKTTLWTSPFVDNYSPAISQDGKLYYGLGDAFIALKPDGKAAWYYNGLDGNLASSSSPSIDANGNIYYVHDGLWSFFPSAQGTPLSALNWVIPELVFLQGSPAIGLDGIIYYGSSYGLVAMNSNKTLKWIIRSENFNSQTPYIQYNPENPAYGSVIILENNQGLSSFDLDGNRQWTFADFSNQTGALDIALASDGAIYLSTNTGFKALNYDGTLKFSSKEGSAGKMSVDKNDNVLKCWEWNCTGYDKEGARLS